jgi:hypothetical protein
MGKPLEPSTPPKNAAHCGDGFLKFVVVGRALWFMAVGLAPKVVAVG